MSVIKDTFFGGAEKKAAKAQTKALEQSQDLIREGIKEGREAINLFGPQAIQSGQQGFQAALDVFGQSLPAQTQAFQGGNVAAQQALLAGLPQIQNAILGGQVNLSGLQPFQQQLPDLSFFQQQLPQFGSMPEQVQPINNVQSPLAGNFFSGSGVRTRMLNNALSGLFADQTGQQGLGGGSAKFENSRMRLR